VVAVWWLQQFLGGQLQRRGPHSADVVVEIPSGAGLRATLQRLQQAGVIADARQIELALRTDGQIPQVRKGRYRIAAGASAQDIIDQLVAGRVMLESLTIPEGYTFAQFRSLLEAHPGIRADFRGRSEQDIMAALGQPQLLAEGRFFPDTYRFAYGSRDIDLYTQAFRAMQERLAAAWAQRREPLPVRSAQEALILASIVEKETGIAAERPRIAGVFINRLNRGMRLQSDPTVIYGLGVSYDGNIRERDLRTDTPYNTYTRGGLPPTPIALPGEGALMAVTRPAQTEEFFFVATGRGDGRHVFTRDYASHQAAVADMLRMQRLGSTNLPANAPQ
jgi:UPF0755 protein